MGKLATARNGVVQDDRQFFEHALIEILDRLYGTAYRLTRDKHNAEDLVADTVEKAIKNLDSLKDRDSFRGWMFRILSNTFISGKRKQSLRETTVYDESESEDDENPFWIFDRLHQPFLLWFSNPEIEFVNNLMKEDMEKALDGLHEPYRVVVVLADIEGFKYTEIAEMLGVPVGTVRSRLARGRSHLQRALWRHAKELGLEAASVHKSGVTPNE